MFLCRFYGNMLIQDIDRVDGIKLEDRAWINRHIKDVEIYLSSRYSHNARSLSLSLSLLSTDTSRRSRCTSAAGRKKRDPPVDVFSLCVFAAFCREKMRLTLRA